MRIPIGQIKLIHITEYCFYRAPFGNGSRAKLSENVRSRNEGWKICICFDLCSIEDIAPLAVIQKAQELYPSEDNDDDEPKSLNTLVW
eukprot:scaffold22607_cov123-Cylindrotheca_fusiformis.AAC.29